MTPRQKINLELFIKSAEYISHYDFGSDSFDNDIFSYMLSYWWLGSYKWVLYGMNKMYGMDQSNVDYLICYNDSLMRWERKDKLIKFLKDYLKSEG